MVCKPLAPLGGRAVAPVAWRYHVIRIERLQITAHLRNPCPAFRPATRHRLGFIDQLPTKNIRVVAVEDASYRVAPGCNFFQMFAIEAARLIIGEEEHRAFRVDAEM